MTEGVCGLDRGIHEGDVRDKPEHDIKKKQIEHDIKKI
jgi:hypothetical protein